MGFPQRRSATGGTNNLDTVNHSIVLPADIQSGDLVFAAYTFDGGETPPTIWGASGWTRDWSGCANGCLARLEIHYKVADGSEAGDAIPVVLNSAQKLTYRTIVLTAGSWDPTRTPEGSAVNGTTDPDAPALTPSWGTADTLWLIFAGLDEGAGTHTANTPAGFTVEETKEGTVGGTRTYIARRELRAATLDPAALQTSNPDDYRVAHVAVRGRSGSTGSAAVRPLRRIGSAPALRYRPV